MSNSRDFTCRTYGADRCQHYAPGHNTHWIHAKHVGRSPWGWRDGIVGSIGGLWLTVDYVQVDGQVRVWHHEALSDEVSVGDPVRVHEGLHVVGGPFGWLNVIQEGGLGAVTDPGDPALWAGKVTSGVQDLSTGRAVALDWLNDAD